MVQKQKILISRTDNLGDVVLSIPLAGILKKEFPKTIIAFLGKAYTKDLINTSVNIDEFYDWDYIQKQDVSKQIELIKNIGADTVIHVFPNKQIAKLCKKAGIKRRIGTSHRFFHFLYCNNLVKLGRRKSGLHEAQLNIKLLSPLLLKTEFSLKEISDFYGMSRIEKLNPDLQKLISKDKINVILHPKSKGSAREWGIANFSELVKLLYDNDFKIFITGTEEEGTLMKEFLVKNESKFTNLTGQFTLDELITFINAADVLVAASTGPLHIAAALGKVAVGIYPPIKPMHPGRWAPIGKNADYLVLDKQCNKCINSEQCDCIKSITPIDVFGKIKILSVKH